MYDILFLFVLVELFDLFCFYEEKVKYKKYI